MPDVNVSGYVCALMCVFYGFNNKNYFKRIKYVFAFKFLTKEKIHITLFHGQKLGQVGSWVCPIF